MRISLYNFELSQLGVNHLLTESALLNLFRGECEHGEQLNHYLDNDTAHERGNWDRSVYFKALEEISEAFKQIYKRIVARADTSGCLMFPEIRMMIGGEYKDTHCEESIHADEDRTRRWKRHLGVDKEI